MTEVTSAIVGTNSIWKHRKTGHQYRVLFVALDATNARDGSKVVAYCRHRPDSDDLVGPFVRDIHEFCVKFDKLFDHPTTWD